MRNPIGPFPIFFSTTRLRRRQSAHLILIGNIGKEKTNRRVTQNMHTSSSQEDPGSISQLQNNVHQAECRFQAVFDQAAVGMALVSLDGQWLQLNQKLCDILGYTRLELRRMTFQDITHSDDLDADLAYVQQLLADKIETYAMDKGLTTWRVYGEITQATNNK
jgi:PAS domain S-box-containing protein